LSGLNPIILEVLNIIIPIAVLMATPVRLAILECDSLPPSISKNGYCGLYTSLLHAGADALSIPYSQLGITKWNVKDEMDKYPSPDDIDAILISGSST
jgi:hypothetical protein